MGNIQLLPPLLQNQIAAGEVIERPVSVIKELVENSIDAGASDVVVEVKKGGKAYIRVSDNGSGMDHADAELACTRHATSKISKAEDLFHIGTLGFRGEALASISAISNFTLRTKQKGTLSGTEIKIACEELLSSTEAGMPEGTTIIVEDIFCTLPARKKYLKTDETEYQHISKCLYEIALSHPEVSLTLIHNGKTTFDVRSANAEERIGAILGKKFVESTVDVFVERSDIQVRGRTSLPSACGKSRKHQYLFINGRAIHNPLIVKAVQDAYHRIAEPGTFPQWILFINMPTDAIDVNVHPRKLEVRFMDPSTIFGVIKGAINTTLEKNALQPKEELARRLTQIPSTFQVKEPEKKYTPSPAFQPQSRATSPYAASTQRHSGQTHIQEALSFTGTFLGQQQQAQKTLIQEEHIPHRVNSEFQLIGQVQKCYLVAESTEGMVLIDQHAAHERILFEKLMSEYSKKEISSQQLLTGELIELSKIEQTTYEAHKDTFTELGFEIEHFGDSNYVITAIPSILSSEKYSVVDTFHNVLDQIHNDSFCDNKELTSLAEHILAYTACRSAVKFGDILTKPEQEQLLFDFTKSSRRYTCPHGRCSIVELNLNELKKFFDR